MPDVITIDSNSEDTMVIDLEMYLAERGCCVDINRDISPSEQLVPSSEINSTKTSETLHYFGKLKKLATHLADISGVTLKEQHKGIFSDDDIAFSNLVYDCGNEFMGLCEYLLDVAKSINQNHEVFTNTTNVSQDLSILLSSSDAQETSDYVPNSTS